MVHLLTAWHGGLATLAPEDVGVMWDRISVAPEFLLGRPVGMSHPEQEARLQSPQGRGTPGLPVVCQEPW